MPQWAGSCWYYLRYPATRRTRTARGRPDVEKYWMGDPVDLYVGGAEHAVLHLLYARFWHKVLFDLGSCRRRSRSRSSCHQGTSCLRVPRRRRAHYHGSTRSSTAAGQCTRKRGAEELDVAVEKMAKSANGVNPDDVTATTAPMHCASTRCSWATSSSPSLGIRAPSRA